MLLIHCALLCEAQALIEKYNLKPISTRKLYMNTTIVLYISGIGKENTLTIKYIFKKYAIKKAINIGIAGVNNANIPIGNLYDVIGNTSIDYLPLKTVLSPKKKDTIYENRTILYDMEGEYFLQIALQYIQEKNIFIFKVISDYLDGTILSKDIIKNMIHKRLDTIEKYI